MAGTFDGASDGDLAASFISAHVEDLDTSARAKYFLGMKHEKAELKDGVWHYKTAKLQEQVVRVGALFIMFSARQRPVVT
jgi:hypothetical protein